MKPMKSIYSDLFKGKKVKMISTCTIAPVNIIGTIINIGFNYNEPIFYIKCDKTGKTYTVGGFSKDLQYEFIK